MTRKCVCLCLGAALLGSSGCTTALKQAYYGVRGAAGKFYEVKVVDPNVLAGYESVDIKPFTNGLGPRVPSSVMLEVNDDTPRIITESSLFSSGDRVLRVSGTVIHYTGKSGLMGSVGSVIGGAEECVCRVQLHDDATEELIGEAVCWGSVKSAVRRGAGELGIGVGKGVCAWLSERLPPDVKSQRRDGSG
ncbi:MAG: hypothetical protein GY842_11860 [bacterium]|nr:hypothetical protein [bacterium]